MSAQGNVPPARARGRGGAAIAALIVVFVAADRGVRGGAGCSAPGAPC